VAQVDDPGRSTAGSDDPEFDAIYNSPEFNELRRRFQRLVFPLVAAFLAWYLVYVLCATYAHEFMREELVGRINVGLVFGLLQFLSTFGIAYLYAKRAETEIDGRSTALRERWEAGGGK
jgi:uncharacterized membrane protein (DUF485 family)